MIIVLFNIITFILVVIIVKDYKLGFLSFLCARIAIPNMVRFEVGNISINIFDILTIALLCSLILHIKQIKFKLPISIKYFLSLYIISTLILIFLSSAIVPYSHQIYIFIKKYVFQEILIIYTAYQAFQYINIKKYVNVIISISILCGIYGILAYILGFNPYVNILSLIYNGVDNVFEMFQEESRGVLEGRISGTMPHPLAWGQFWNIIIAFYFIIRKEVCALFKYTFLPIGIINCFLCGSRTSIVTFCIIVVFVLFDEKLRTRVRYSFFFLLFFISLSISQKDNKKFKESISYIEATICFWDEDKSKNAGIGGSSKSMREIQFEESLNIAYANAIGGVGLDYEYYSIDNPSVSNPLLLGFESIIFKKLVEQGFLGLICFFILYYLLFKFLTSNLKKKYVYYGYFISFLSSILITNIQGHNWIIFISLLFLFKLNYKYLIYK